MIRIKSGRITKLRRKKILLFGKGFTSHKFKTLHQLYLKSLTNSFISRKIKKRYFRKLWIKNLSFFLKNFNFKYSYFINSLKSQLISLNRKILFELLNYCYI
jgi:large subunit ribosomal protein L20